MAGSRQRAAVVPRPLNAARAETVDGDDRARLGAALVRLYHPYEAYRKTTDRVFPIVRLTPF